MSFKKIDNTEIGGGIIINNVFYPKLNISSETLRIVLTSKCNFNCIYCFNEGEVDKCHRELEVDFIKKVVEAGKEFNIKKIKLTGGEPLLYSNLEQLLKTLRNELEIEYIDMTTNISLLNEKNIKLLNKYSINALTLSLDSLNKDVFNKLTDTNSANLVFKNLSDTIKNFNGKIRLNSIVFNYGLENYKEIINFALKNNCGLRLVEPTKMPNMSITHDKRGFNKICDYLENTCDKKVTSACESVIYYFYDEQYITIMKSLCDNLLCDLCKDYMYIRLTSEKALKPCLARRDTEIDISSVKDKEEMKGKFIEAIYNMGKGIK